MKENYLKSNKNGVTVEIFIKPSSPAVRFIKNRERGLGVRLKAPPYRGKANKELIKVFSKYLNIKKDNIKIIKGEKNRKKVILLEKVSLEDIEDKLEKLI
ncbi:MAG: DUF167 domain-containing protein [Actinomycetia bacterium]|nr:DUF167 domain-containing protein [Actinomycetes bacterium]